MIGPDTARIGSVQNVSRLGMGCWAIGGHGWGETNDEESLDAIQHAFELGCNFFDTADVYGLGHSETLLGRALAGHKDRAIIATKVGIRWDSSRRTWKDCSPAYLRQAVDESRSRLQLDSIPLCYVHWPDNVTPVCELIEEMARLREKKFINAVGLSNFSLQQLQEAVSIAKIDALQFKSSIIYRTGVSELLRFCLENGVTPVLYGVLADGLLTNKFNASSTFVADDHRNRLPEFQGEQYLKNLKIAQKVAKLAAQLNALPGQLALRWTLDAAPGSIALFGAKTAEQVDQNLRARELNLSAENKRLIDALVSE